MVFTPEGGLCNEFVYNAGMNSVLVLKRGEELHAALARYAETSGLQSAWLSGLGGAGSVTLGFYDINAKSYIWKTYDTPLEIVSLTGNLAFADGQQFWHVHGVFSDAENQTIGGHVKELIVGLTTELHVTSLDQPLLRQFDDETGLKLLDNSD